MMSSDYAKPLADLIAEVDAAVAQMTPGEWFSIFYRLCAGVRKRERAIILGDYEFDNERDAEGIVSLRNAWPRVSAELRNLQRDRDAGWNGLANLYEVIRGQECPRTPDVALGMATSAVQSLLTENATLRAEVSRLTGELEVIYERRQPLTVETETDNAQPAVVRLALLQCLRAWQPAVRVLGNVRAGDAERAIVEAQDRCAALEAENAQLRAERDQVVANADANLALYREQRQENAQLRATLERTLQYLTCICPDDGITGKVPTHYHDCIIAEVRRVLGGDE